MGAVYTLQGEGWWSNWIACDFLFGPYVMDLYLSIYSTVQLQFQPQPQGCWDVPHGQAA